MFQEDPKHMRDKKGTTEPLGFSFHKLGSFSLTCTCVHAAAGWCNSVHTGALLKRYICVLVLTDHVQGVGVIDGSKLVLHYAGVVALVRRHHALHDEGPVLASHLGTKRRQRREEVGFQSRTSRLKHRRVCWPFGMGEVGGGAKLALNEKNDRGDLVDGMKDENWWRVRGCNIAADDRLIPSEGLFKSQEFPANLQITLTAGGEKTKENFRGGDFIECISFRAKLHASVPLSWTRSSSTTHRSPHPPTLVPSYWILFANTTPHPPISPLRNPQVWANNSISVGTLKRVCPLCLHRPL